MTDSSKFPAQSISRTRSTSETSVNPFSTTVAREDDRPLLADSSSGYSSHTLRTLHDRPNGGGGTDSESDGDDDANPSTIHVNHNSPADSEDPTSLAALQSQEVARERRRVIVRAFAQLAILFVVCTVVMGGTLYFALPKIDEEDKPSFRIPKNFDQLKALNNVLQRYKDENFARVMLCWIMVYMFLQAFSIPGSMYMSILAGAMWGVPLALPIVCASVATGATICYLISMLLGSVLIAMPSWQARVDSWKVVIERQRNDLLSYMIVIRMMPLPPHNIVNILAPHLGISLPLFWISTFFGIFAVSVIHTTIGEKLDQMTSPADFQLFTVRNALLLGGVCVAVMIPVLVRKRSEASADPLESDEGRVRLEGEEGTVPAVGRRTLLGRRRRDSNSDDDDDDDELPPVSMRGAIAGFSRNSTRTRHAEDDLEADATQGVDSTSHWATSASDDEDGNETDTDSFRGFEDRREQQRQQNAPTNNGTRNGKAVRVLGLGNQTSSNGAASSPAGVGAGIAQSLGGLWNKVVPARRGQQDQDGRMRL